MEPMQNKDKVLSEDFLDRALRDGQETDFVTVKRGDWTQMPTIKAAQLPTDFHDRDSDVSI